MRATSRYPRRRVGVRTSRASRPVQRKRLNPWTILGWLIVLPILMLIGFLMLIVVGGMAGAFS